MTKGKLTLTIEGYNTKFSTEISDEASANMLMYLFVSLAVTYGYSRKNFIDMLGSDPNDWDNIYRELERLGDNG